jgi:hypothetical protein|tara:strand:- start:645 stop:929 length:285 start_codon:yes stop_codon:yes gene_type:complete
MSGVDGRVNEEISVAYLHGFRKRNLDKGLVLITYGNNDQSYKMVISMDSLREGGLPVDPVNGRLDKGLVRVKPLDGMFEGMPHGIMVDSGSLRY